MKMFVPLVALVILQCFLAINASSSVSISSKFLTLQGKAHIKFLEPQEKFWAGLSDARRYPVIHSGNIIALAWGRAYSNYMYRWVQCGATSSYCYFSYCPGDTVMKSNKWSSCRKEQFYIRAVNKNDGQPILSGDYVTLAPYNRGSTCRLRCHSSSSSYCDSKTCVSESYFKGSNAFKYSWLTFQIFSRHSRDGIDPVQYGDMVAFRYPYYYTHYWMYYGSSYLKVNSCTRSSKHSCATKSNYFGFRIFKQL